MKMHFAVVFILLFPLIRAQNDTQCNSDLYAAAIEEDGKLVVKGDAVQYNGGTLTTYLVLEEGDGCGAPLAVGLEMRLNLTALPNEDEVAMQPPPQCKADPYAAGCPPPLDDVPISFPGTNTSFSPFKWMGFNWNPVGHPPLDVYSLPHFDLHFWVQEEKVKSEITPGTPPDVCGEGLSPEAFARAHEPIPSACFPEGYANLNAVAPFMGNHYIDLAEPVIKAGMSGAPDPSKWTEPSWIIGGFDGSIVFFEPMIRLSYLQGLNGTRKCFEPVMPVEYSVASFYPTEFCVDGTTPGVITVEMTNFVQKPAGCNGTDMAISSYITAVTPPPGSPPLPDVCKAPLPKTPCASPTSLGCSAPAPSASSPAPSPSSSPPTPAPTPSSSSSIGLSMTAAVLVGLAGFIV